MTRPSVHARDAKRIGERVLHEKSPRTANATLTLVTFGAALTSSWTGIRVAGINVVDMFLVAGVALALIDAIAKGRRLPIYAWAVLPPVSLLAIALISSVLQGESLLASRETWKYAVGYSAGAEYSGAIPFVARMALSLTAVSIIVVSITNNSRDRYVLIEKLMFTWAAGAVISALYGVVESLFGLGSLPLLYQIISDTRAAGFATHPNSFGQTIAYVLPVLIYMFSVSRGLWKAIAGISLPISMYAVFLSGSRGALLCGIVFAVLTFVYIATAGKRMHILMVPLAGIVLFVAALTAPAVLGASRFFDESGNISNSIRIARLETGIDLFFANPLFGSGVGSWFAEMVPLILLTSGGMLYFAIFYASLFHPLLVRPRKSATLLVPILVITAFEFVAFGLVNNGVVERYLYWPFAALFALGIQSSVNYASEGHLPTHVHGQQSD